MKLSRLWLPILVMLTLTGLLHRYVWTHLVRDADWPPVLRLGLTVGLIVMALSIPVLFFAMRSLPRLWLAPISMVIYSWMGVLFYLFLFSALADGFSVLASWWPALSPPFGTKVQFARQEALGIGGLSLALGLLGVFTTARGFKIRRVKVPLTKLSLQGTGFRIAQLSDIHVGPTVGKAFVERMVAATNALKPDLIAITGDLVDGTVDQLREAVAPLRNLKAKHGVFFVTGNHEYYSGADAWIAHVESLGMRVLRNERVNIDGLFDLAGVDDYTAARMHDLHGQDIAKAVAGHDGKLPLLLLAHQPKAFREAAEVGIDLQLSGHVHGGQMFPFGWLARLDQPLVSGLYRRDNTWIYVSEGTGYWGPPMRVGTRCEIAVLELVADG